MNSEFDRARKDWDDEVDREAARLVRAGVPPFDAARQAHENVSQRRREDAEYYKTHTFPWWR